MHEDVPRIPPEEARRHLDAGALLVCAYDDEDKCRKLRLDRALTLAELERRDPDRAQEIVFYCA